MARSLDTSGYARRRCDLRSPAEALAKWAAALMAAHPDTSRLRHSSGCPLSEAPGLAGRHLRIKERLPQGSAGWAATPRWCELRPVRCWVTIAGQMVSSYSSRALKPTSVSISKVGCWRSGSERQPTRPRLELQTSIGVRCRLTRACSGQARVGRGSARAPASSRPSNGSIDLCER
jgi:hypothetical protein